MAPNHVVTLVGRDGCHLCDDARRIVTGVLSEVSSSGITLTEVSIDDDPALHEQYWEQIPVVLIDGKVHNFWRIDPIRLKNALTL